LSTASETPPFPRLRWAALAFLLAWVPAYGLEYGFANFLFLCDVSLILTCLGLAWGSALLLSSQAVLALVVDTAWSLDLAANLLLGRPLVGGTEYMLDPRIPLAVRLLSLFHVALPPLLVWAISRTGYDRRGLPVQVGLTALLLVASRAAPAEANLNGAFRDLVFHRSWGPAPVHLAVVLAGLTVFVYAPTHLALQRLLPASR
jgi:hypothetical protein